MSTPTGGNQGGGTDGANLILGVDTKDGIKNVDQLEKALNSAADTADLVGTKIGTATIRAVTGLNELKTSAQATSGGFKELEQSILDVINAEKEADKIRQATFEAGARFIAQLTEMNATFGMGTAELQTYKAGLLGVSEAAAPLIGSLEAMKAATAQYGVVITDVSQIEKARAEWEEMNMVVLNAQRIRMRAENAEAERVEQERQMTNAAVLQAFKTRTIAENAELDRIEQARIMSNAEALQMFKRRTLEENAAAEAADIERQKMNAAVLQAFKLRTIAENDAALKAEIEAAALAAARIAEKQAIEEIAWAKLSVKARIDELEKLKAYQASSAISPEKINSTFSSAAINDMSNLARYQQEYAAAVAATTSAHSAAHGPAKTFAQTLDDINLKSSRARSEIIVLAHEAVQGRFSRMGPSMMVLAEYTNAASLAFTGMGVATLGLVGGLALLIYEMVQGQNQVKAFNDALNRTNGYAGETRSSLTELAMSVGSLHGQYTEAYKAAAQLTASGKFTADQIQGITGAVVGLEHAFGTDLNKSIKEFETLSIKGTAAGVNGTLQVTKAISKLDDQYHFLTASQMEQIIALEKEGKARDASAMAIALYTNEAKSAAKDAEEYIGWIAKAWHGVTAAIHTAGQTMAGIGAKNTAAQNLAKAQSTVDFLSHGPNGATVDLNDKAQVNKIMGLAAALRALDFAQMGVNVENAKAADRAAWTKTQSDAAHELANRAIEDARLMKKGQTELQAALAKNDEQNRIIEAAQPGYMEANKKYLAERVEAIKKMHTATTAARASSSGRREMSDDLLNEQAAFESEKNVYESRLRMIDTFHKSFDVSDADYYASRKVARDEFIASEAKSFESEKAIIQAYKPTGKGSDDDAANKLRYDKLLKQHQDFVDKMRNAGGDDDIGQLANAKKVQDESDKAFTKHLGDLEEDAKKLEDNNVKHQQSAEVLAHENVLIYEQAVALMAVQAAREVGDGSGATQADIDAAKKFLVELNLQLAAYKRIDEATGDAEGYTRQEKAAKAAVSAWRSFSKELGDSLEHAFGRGGKAFGDMIKGFGEGTAKQLDLKQKLAESTRGMDEDDIRAIKLKEQYNDDLTRVQIDQMADMTQASQGFFDQNSKGYAAMQAATEVLRIAEVGLSVIKGVNAVLTQGAGDPYTAFSRMAAMAAVVVGLGVALTGGVGGSDTKAADLQKANGTGSILGDSSAKSSSIARAIELVGKNSSIELNYTRSMAQSLQAIEDNIGSFAALVVKTTGIDGKTAPDSLAFTGKTTTALGTVGGAVGGAAVAGLLTAGFATLLTAGIGALVGALFGSQINKALNSVFGGSQSVTDAGITANKATLGQVSTSGLNANQYTDVTTSGGWFSSDKHDTNLKSLGAETNAQFTLVVKSLAEGVTQASKILGVSGDAFTDHLNQFVVDIGEISTKGLTGDQVEKALQTAFSKMGDDMANWAISGLGQFQKVGEGSLETLVRLANDYATLDAGLNSIGKTFGQVGLGCLTAREHLIQLAGGLDTLTSQISSYSDNYLTEAEKLAPVTKYVNDQMAALGLSSITTREGFKQLVTGIDTSTTYGAQLFTTLMSLQQAFADTHAASVDLTKTEQQVADERKDLQDQLDELTMSSADLLKKQRDAIDASNRGLFDQIQAAQKVKDANDALKSSLGDTITKMKSFAESTRSLSDSLLLSDSSTMTPAQKYAEAQRQYEETRNAAVNGDATAQGNYAAAVNAFLAASDVVNSHDSQYSSDLAEVLKYNALAAKWADSQVNTAQATLDAMNAQGISLDTLNQTSSNIEGLIRDVAGFWYSTTDYSPSTSSNVSTVSVDIAPLSAQVASLKQEIIVLQTQLINQTNGIMQVTAASNQTAAATVVQGVKDSAVDSSWSTNNESLIK